MYLLDITVAYYVLHGVLMENIYWYFIIELNWNELSLLTKKKKKKKTGGQDDLVTIWSFKENKIIARCQGHRSWVYIYLIFIFIIIINQY